MKFTEINIIKNFEYPTACVDMCLSEDKKHLVSVGTYSPCVKIHDLPNLSQKCERHLESEAFRVICLTKDAEKLAILRNTRILELHAKYGHHYSLRLPNICYDMGFNGFNLEVLVSGQSNFIYRLNLEQGRFLRPYFTTIEEISCLDVNKVHGLIGYCGENSIQFIDPRTREVVSNTKFDYNPKSFTFSNNGVSFCTGSEDGEVFSYDLRSKNEQEKYNLGNGSVSKLSMDKRRIVTSDNKCIKIFEDSIEKGCLEFESGVNTFEICDGLLFAGLEGSKMKMFYSTEFGEIPGWCNVLKVEENT